MAYNVSGDLAIGRALGLGVLTTAQRTSGTYTPLAGHMVYDVTDGNIYRHDGTSWVPLVAQKNNFVATVDPLVTDDATAGYAAGSLWLNATAKKLFICEDVATNGAAVWERIDQPKSNYAAIAAPTASDDTTAGYEVGSHWFDTTANVTYVCLNATATTAVWERVDSPKFNVATVDPLVGDDGTKGYEVGSFWFNTANAKTYVCLSVTTGAAVWERLDNPLLAIKTVAPTSADNASLGYEIGSLWINTLTNQTFICLNATAGSVIWERLDSPKINVGTMDPTATDDSAAGYEAGSLWFNTSGKMYVCHDATATAAVWERVDQPKFMATTTNPLVGSDNTAGYETGSLWINTTTQATYICMGAATGAAVWERLDAPKSNYAATVAPTATDDSAAGYEVGSHWYDVTADRTYVCVDATATAAVWKETSLVKHNFVATIAPAGTDNAAAGYQEGSLWYVASASTLYVYVSEAAGVATWELMNTIKHNFTSTAAPDPTKDISLGYEAGSLWFETLTTNLWVCTDSTATAAKWEMINTVKNNFNATVAPAATDDGSAGYEVGSIWVDINNKKSYISLSAGTGTAVWERLDNPKLNIAVLDPTVSADSTAGYEVGSFWINTATKKVFVAHDVTTSNAVWERLDGAQVGSGIVDPSATDDSAAGYEVGSYWINTATSNVFFCIDATATSAVWVKMGGEITVWGTGVAYPKGAVVVAPDGSLIQAVSARPTTVTTFDATEAGNWNRLGQISVNAWTTGIYYYAGTKALIATNVTATRSVAGVAAATFTFTEAANWTYDSQRSINAYAASSVYLANEMIVYGGVLYKRTATSTALSGATFDAVEKALWTRITAEAYEHLIADATTAWGTAATGLYTITIAAATHGIVNPTIVQVYEKVGTDYDFVQVDRLRVLANGDIAVSVSDVPDGRFIGKVVIS